MRVLGVITARGGSKGIPGKNLKRLAGQPLIWHTLQSAAASASFDRVILSTDDHAIANFARVHGCEVPFLRPADLAQDETPHLPVLQHAVAWLKEQEGYRPDAVMILQPTSPLRRAEDIREAVRLLETTGADSVLTVSAVSTHIHPLRMLRVGDDGTARLYVSGAPISESRQPPPGPAAGVADERRDLPVSASGVDGANRPASTAIARSPCRFPSHTT